MSGKLRSVQRVFFFFLYVCKTMFFFVVLFCFLSEQEACDFEEGGGGRICTVLLTKLVKPPNESCETGREEATSWSHFLIVVDVSLMTSSWQGLVDLPHCSWAALVPRIGPLLRSWGAEQRGETSFSLQRWLKEKFTQKLQFCYYLWTDMGRICRQHNFSGGCSVLLNNWRSWRLKT